MFMFLNPLTFNRKYRSAINILSARITFEHLSKADQSLALNMMETIESDVRRHNIAIDEMLERYSYIEFHLLLALALANLNVFPMYGFRLWEKIKNPHLDGLGCEPVLEIELNKYHKKTGQQTPNLKDMSIFKQS